MAAACTTTFNPTTHKLICGCGEELLPLLTVVPQKNNPTVTTTVLQILHASKASEFADTIRGVSSAIRIYAFGKDVMPLELYLSVLAQLKKFPVARAA